MTLGVCVRVCVRVFVCVCVCVISGLYMDLQTKTHTRTRRASTCVCVCVCVLLPIKYCHPLANIPINNQWLIYWQIITDNGSSCKGGLSGMRSVWTRDPKRDTGKESFTSRPVSGTRDNWYSGSVVSIGDIGQLIQRHTIGLNHKGQLIIWISQMLHQARYLY